MVALLDRLRGAVRLFRNVSVDEVAYIDPGSGRAVNVLSRTVVRYDEVLFGDDVRVATHIAVPAADHALACEAVVLLAEARQYTPDDEFGARIDAALAAKGA